ncbi:MAG: hypothetical protein L0Z62_50925, partial [Gemmataceae bacterium]|nr:hypothetical protein [Gemmataceae bacterium]
MKRRQNEGFFLLAYLILHFVWQGAGAGQTRPYRRRPFFSEYSANAFWDKRRHVPNSGERTYPRRGVVG